MISNVLSWKMCKLDSIHINIFLLVKIFQTVKNKKFKRIFCCTFLELFLTFAKKVEVWAGFAKFRSPPMVCQINVGIQKNLWLACPIAN